MNYMPGHRLLWVFDFDGTLSLIVPDRAEAPLEKKRMAGSPFQTPYTWKAPPASRGGSVKSRMPRRTGTW